MAQIAPTPSTPLGPVPTTADPANFDSRADAFLAALPTYQTELDAIADVTYDNAVDAYNSSVASAASAATSTAQAAISTANATAAAASAGATTWANTGATYAIGDLKRSPLNGRIYRRLTASNAGTTDPSVDTTNWAPYGIESVWIIKTGNYTAIVGDAILADTTGGAFTITLPATPVFNDTIPIADYAGTFAANKLTIARNGSNINGLAENMDADVAWLSFKLVYSGPTMGWRTI